MDINQRLGAELSVAPKQVEAAVKLIDDGNTIPFIARYRKEQTGNLDDQLLRQLAERLHYLRGLEERKGEVLASIEKAGALTGELRRAVEGANTLTELEDLYRPYRPKRRTRASMAKERGLAPLADTLRSGKRPDGRPGGPALEEARAYCTGEEGLATPEEALQGAMDILAEEISDDPTIRRRLRQFFTAAAALCCEGKEGCAESVYKNYLSYREPVRAVAGHRVLAIDRGEKEGFLKVSLDFDRDRALAIAQDKYPGERHPYGELLRRAGEDAFDRLILPSAFRELRAALTETACQGAIRVFGANLKQLLMQPPVRGKVVLGLDPAYRTGCKIAVVDATGKVLETAVVYPTPPQKKVAEAARTLLGLIRRYGVEVISIGNGTASKESELFVADLIRENGLNVSYAVVSEAGASVYSASPLAAKEFPQFDVSLRSAVSIARRLQDPLAELVKIDPESIGVGQYQHDMPKKELRQALEGVVEDCVNTVGVDLNTASPSLLAQVSGISAAVAQNIVARREELGPFAERRDLLAVPKLGPKAYKQAAGFLRIPGGKNPLDQTAVHPESYPAAKKLLALCGCKPADLAGGGLDELGEKLAAFSEEALEAATGAGSYTLKDIAQELQKPGRDPRDELPQPVLRQDLMDIKDLKPGMKLTGTVRNIVDFGAFVDIGVHQDGLVHISRLSKRFVKHPLDVVKVGDVVTVWVLEVDTGRGRISLTMLEP